MWMGRQPWIQPYNGDNPAGDAHKLLPACYRGLILTCYDQLGVEELGVCFQLVIVDVTSFGVDLGGEEEDSVTLVWVKIKCSTIIQKGVLGA